MYEDNSVFYIINCVYFQLPVSDKVEELETLTSNSSMLGSTEVAASVSVLVTATDELAGNLTVR